MRKTTLFLFLLIALSVVSSACTLATIRSIEDDQTAKEGFNPEGYVNGIWESQLLTTIQDNAIEVTQLLSQLETDEQAAIEAYGNRSGTGAFSFMIYGEAKVLEVDRESRIGLMSLELAPYDGEVEANMAIGPVIRNRNNAVRDAVGFIQFNDFVNQTEFAGVSSAIKDRILRDVISAIDLDNIVGQTIRFSGAFTWDNPSNIEIVPVTLEVTG
jgi:predicted lipoprotein